ncbi:hypothetical protein [Phaeobacter sp. HF9A]|uniref:DUF6950 family protein n=1 Tax=Phaeobacter sp. HF9A TaxID=2721561 RepID=UPI001431F2AC|nr:hypothetical protein [Phaeobacter sp. HF9A]NIZ12912.1 hypothetical protein [Phaeobacter sp. HF9A]
MGGLRVTRAELLLRYLSTRRQEWCGFRPGRADCALFAGGWVQFVSGRDLMGRFGSYKTLEEGKAMIRQAGFEDLAALAASALPEVAVDAAEPGDVAAIRSEGEYALGILGGPQVHVLTLSGLSAISACNAERVFRP